MGAVIDAYLWLLGALLAGVAVFVVVFVFAMARGPIRGRPVSIVLGAGSGVAVTVLGLGTMVLATALLTPVLVVAATLVVLVAMGYTAWRLLRPLARSSI
jgi:hypothetical protein